MYGRVSWGLIVLIPNNRKKMGELRKVEVITMKYKHLAKLYVRHSFRITLQGKNPSCTIRPQHAVYM